MKKHENNKRPIVRSGTDHTRHDTRHMCQAGTLGAVAYAYCVAKGFTGLVSDLSGSLFTPQILHEVDNVEASALCFPHFNAKFGS
jgi:hypothetical protein